MGRTLEGLHGISRVLGYSRGKSKSSISQQTWKVIKIQVDSFKSKRIRQRIREEYRQKDK